MTEAILSLKNFIEKGLSRADIVRLAYDWKNTPALKRWLQEHGFDISRDIQIINYMDRDSHGQIVYSQRMPEQAKMVLVCNPNSIFLNEISKALKTHGHKVVCEEKFNEVTERLRLFKNTNTTFDIAIVDGNMKGPLQTELYKYILSQNPTIKLLVTQDKKLDKLAEIVDNCLSALAENVDVKSELIGKKKSCLG